MTELNEKQIQILQVAEKLFADKGFDGTSIRDIAREANINIAMVSYYFGSKERMLNALIEFRTADIKLQLENIMQAEITPWEKIERFIDLYLQRMERNRCVYQILHFELASKRRIIDIKAFAKVKQKNMESFRKIVEDGQNQGVFRKDVNITLIPPTIMGTFFHFHMNRPFFEDMLDITTDEAYNNYLKTDLAKHIKQTIKALLTHEN